MSNLKFFLKDNVEKIDNVKYTPTTRIKDDKGVPIEWEFRVLTTTELETIKTSSTKYIRTGKKNQVTPQLNTAEFTAKMISSCTIFPNLLDKNLQNSYGVLEPEQLLKAILCVPGEYDQLSNFIMSLNGYNTDDDDDIIQEIKN